MDMKRTGQKTYSHLAAAGRIPSEYELLSSKLLYYPGRGFEVDHPNVAMFTRYQINSPLQADNWELFEDPRQTTYASYVRLQHAQETFVDGLLEAMEPAAYQGALSPTWLKLLERILPPLRFLFHGLQMIACHIGHLAPSGRITLVAMFQAADEMRRVQRIAYRMGQIRRFIPNFGESSREQWETDPLWTPCREMIERLLVIYDWGESFAGLNLGIKPIVESSVLERLAQAATAHGDPMLSPLLGSLRQDGLWHQQWAGQLERMAGQSRQENTALLSTWAAPWRTAAETSLRPISTLLNQEAG